MAEARLPSIPRALHMLQERINEDDKHVRIAAVDVVMRLVPFHSVSAAEAPQNGQLPLRSCSSTSADERCVYIEPDRQTVVAIDPQSAPSAPVSQRQSRQRLDLGVHAESSNTSMCSTLTQVAVHQWLFQGFNTNIVAFGRASTGKSALLLGDATYGTGNVAADAGFDDIFSTCVSAVFCSQASKQEYMCAMSAWELSHAGAVDLLSHAAAPQLLSLRPSDHIAPCAAQAASVLCTSASDAHRLLLAAKGRSASWASAPHRIDAAVPVAAASHVVVALRLLHVPSGRASVLHIVDTGGWAAESRLGSAHDTPPRGASTDSTAARAMRRQCYYLRQWLRNLGSAARAAGRGVNGGSPHTSPGAHLRQQALAVPAAKETPLNKMLSWLVLGNAKTFLLGCASCYVGDYFDTLSTLRCLASAAAVKVPIVPCIGATAAGLGPLLSVTEVLPDALAAATGHPLASQVRPRTRNTNKPAASRVIQESAWGQIAGHASVQEFPPRGQPAGGGRAADAAPPPAEAGVPATTSDTHMQQMQTTSSCSRTVDAALQLATQHPPTPVDTFINRPLSSHLFTPPTPPSTKHQRSPASSTVVSGCTVPSASATPPEPHGAALERLLAADTGAEALQGPSLLDMAAQMNALVGDLLRSDVPPATRHAATGPDQTVSSSAARSEQRGARQPSEGPLPSCAPVPQYSSAECSTAGVSASASETVSLYSLEEVQGGLHSQAYGGWHWRPTSPSAASVSSSITQHTADITASAAAMQRLSNPPSGASTPTGEGGHFDGVGSFRPLPLPVSKSRELAAPPASHRQRRVTSVDKVVGASAPGSDSEEEGAFRAALLGGGLQDSLLAAMGAVDRTAKREQSVEQTCVGVFRGAPGKEDGGGLRAAIASADSSLAGLAQAAVDGDTASTDSLEQSFTEAGTTMQSALADKVGDIILRHAVAGHPLGRQHKGVHGPSNLGQSVRSGTNTQPTQLGHIDTVLLQEEHRQLSEQHARLTEAHQQLQANTRQLALKLKDTATAAEAVHVQAAADCAGSLAEASSARAALRAAARGQEESLWEWYEGLLDKANAETEHLRRQNTQLSLKLASVIAPNPDPSAVLVEPETEEEHGQEDSGVVTMPRATWLRTQRQLSSTLKRNTALEAAHNKRNKGDRVAAATHRRLHRVTGALARSQAAALTALSAAESAQLDAAAATADRNSTRSGLLSAKAAAVLAGEQVALLQGEVSGLRSYFSQAADSAIALRGLPQGDSSSRKLQAALNRAQHGCPPTPKGVKGGYGVVPMPDDQQLVPWEPTRTMPAQARGGGVKSEKAPPLPMGATSGDPSLEMRAAFSALLHDAAASAPGLIPRLQALQSRVYSPNAPVATAVPSTVTPPPNASQGRRSDPPQTVHVAERTLPQVQWGAAWASSLRSGEATHN